jgi:hypothetical protein
LFLGVSHHALPEFVLLQAQKRHGLPESAFVVALTQNLGQLLKAMGRL